MTEKIASRLASVLGATSIVVGNINGSGDLEVRGKVQGNISTIGRIVISSGGVVLGNIEATTLEVAGEVRGDLRANDGVQIASSGQVIGQINAPRVGIEAGAIVRGQLTTGKLKSAQVPPAAAKAKAAAAKPQAAPLESHQKPKENVHAPKAQTKRRTSADRGTRAEEVQPDLDATPPMQADGAIIPQGVHSLDAPPSTEQDNAPPRPPRKRRRKPRTRAPASFSELPPSASPAQKSESRPESTPTPLLPEQEKKEPLKSDPSKNLKLSRPTPSKISRESSKAPVTAPKVPTFTKGTKGHRR